MRHLVSNKKLNRDKDHRRALIKVQLGQLLTNSKLETTETKAKIVKSAIESLLVKAQKPSLHIRRQLRVKLGDESLVKKAIDLAAKLDQKNGGFVKSVRLGRRRGDNTMIIRMELEKPVQAVDTKAKTDKKDTDKKTK